MKKLALQKEYGLFQESLWKEERTILQVVEVTLHQRTAAVDVVFFPQPNRNIPKNTPYNKRTSSKHIYFIIYVHKWIEMNRNESISRHTEKMVSSE